MAYTLRMARTPKTLKISMFTGVLAIAALLWLYLARNMPLRYVAFMGILTLGLVAVELTARKTLAKRIQETPRFELLLELALGLIFVVSFYLFAVHIYPGMK
jgi:asparagine N-glycosylation enzyme membrane subunit Stt3